MALVRSSPLLTTAAQVVDLTGVQDLANLESDSEYSVADHLAAAHEWVYDRVKARFGRGAPAELTNESYLKRALVARYLENLYSSTLDDPEKRDYWAAQAREELDEFVPDYSSDDEPARAESIPRVKNLTSSTSGPLFGSLS